MPTFAPTKAFESVGESLTEQQIQVANVVAEAVLGVWGAAGVGKTRALIARFKKLVAGGLAPEEILVLAATRESAAALRDALALELQGATLGPLCRTASSVAHALVRQRALAAQQPLPELISGAEQDAILARLIAQREAESGFEGWPSHLDRVTRSLAGFRAEVRQLIATAQEFGLSASDLAQLAPERQDWRSGAQLLADYELELSKPEYLNRFDSPSLMRAAIGLLQSEPEVLGNYKVVLVDDAQEITPSIAMFIQTLVGLKLGLTTFADPDATVMGFRGAMPQLVTQLLVEVAARRSVQPQIATLLPGPEQARHRLAGLLARVANQLPAGGAVTQRQAHVVSSIAAGDAVSATSAANEPPAVQVAAFGSVIEETAWLARKLREFHLYQQVPWQEMAVVARSRQSLELLERTLAAEGVPVRIRGAQAALRDEFASGALLEVAALAVGGQDIDAATAVKLLSSPFCGLDNLGLRRLRRALRYQEMLGDGTRNSDELLVEIFAQENALETIKSPEAKQARRFVKNFHRVSTFANDSTKTIEDLLWGIWDPSGLEAKWSELSRGVGEVAVQANRDLDSVVALFGAANRYIERNPGATMAVFLEQQLEQSLPEDSIRVQNRGRQTVDLVTPSGLVGNRYQVVATPQLIEGVWPNLKPRSSLLGATDLAAKLTGNIDSDGRPLATEIADERRMFYKAVGAADRFVLVSSYEAEESQFSQFLALANGKVPEVIEHAQSSLTLRGLVGDLRRKLAVSTNPNQQVGLALALAELATAGIAGAHPEDWYGLAALSTDEPLFVLGDSTLDENGDEFHADQVVIYPSQLDDFIKCPLHWFLNHHGAKEKLFSANLGTLVHSAVENLTTISAEAVWEQLESKWHTLRFESKWQEAAERRKANVMVSNLVEYLAASKAAGDQLLATEAGFKFQLGGVEVRGKIDRIEQKPDGSLVIVDIKTGKRKPSAKELGEHPQLGLYQLAYVNGALRESVPEDTTGLDSATLVFVAEKLDVKAQESITQNEQLRKYFEDLVKSAAEGMAMPNRVFLAKVSSHCSNDEEYGTCALHLTRSVSFYEQ